MKKITLNYLIIIALIFSAAFTSCGSKSRNSVKLLKSITYDHPGNLMVRQGEKQHTMKFEYDRQNRITKIHHHGDGKLVQTEILTYEGDDLVSVTHAIPWDYDGGWQDMFFQREGNKIVFWGSMSSNTLTLDENGYILKKESQDGESGGYGKALTTYEYQDGNLVKITWEFKNARGRVEYSSITKLEYDDKNSPFLNCNTPRWFLQSHFGFSFGLKNNVTESQYTYDRGRSTDYSRNSYDYDSDGFPIKQITVKQTSDGTKSTTTAVFTYRGRASKVKSP